MLREQMINFPQGSVIFPLITNAFAVAAAVCAIRLLAGAPLQKRQAAGVIERRIELMFPSKKCPEAPTQRFELYDPHCVRACCGMRANSGAA